MKDVFVIDDDADVREIMIFSLENEGFSVIPFESPMEALKVLLDKPKDRLPGLIIVDFMMPEMDGVTFIRELRDNHAKALGHIPVALSTAMGSMEESPLPSDIIRLHKPMELDDLIKVVNKYCRP